MFGKKLIGCAAGLAALYLTMFVGSLVSQEMRAGEDSFRKGKASMEEFECEKAIEHFSEAINANPEEPEYFLERAKCRTMLNANTAAPANSAVRKTPKMPATVALAVADLDAAIKIDPEYSPAYFVRAEVKSPYAAPGSPAVAETVKDYDKAIELESGKAEYKFAKARFLLDYAGDEKAGLAVYASMLAETPNDLKVIVARANYFMRAKKYDCLLYTSP
ncbi:MAG: hypothetical protein QUS14_03280, partial [Pyrinomonadaceae bacterium]|nr:hypothetical protein [Pyrinomonadaceae bacterium]